MVFLHAGMNLTMLVIAFVTYRVTHSIPLVVLAWVILTAVYLWALVQRREDDRLGETEDDHA